MPQLNLDLRNLPASYFPRLVVDTHWVTLTHTHDWHTMEEDLDVCSVEYLSWSRIDLREGLEENSNLVAIGSAAMRLNSQKTTPSILCGRTVAHNSEGGPFYHRWALGVNSPPPQAPFSSPGSEAVQHKRRNPLISRALVWSNRKADSRVKWTTKFRFRVPRLACFVSSSGALRSGSDAARTFVADH